MSGTLFQDHADAVHVLGTLTIITVFGLMCWPTSRFAGGFVNWRLVMALSIPIINSYASWHRLAKLIPANGEYYLDSTVSSFRSGLQPIASGSILFAAMMILHTLLWAVSRFHRAGSDSKAKLDCTVI